MRSGGQATSSGKDGLAERIRLRGKMLLHSTWTDLLDRTPAELQDLAFQASSQGWINYKAAGGVVEITLPEIPAKKAEGLE